MRQAQPNTVLQVVAPGQVGGLERVVHSLSAGLHRQGCPVVVAVLGANQADVNSYARSLGDSGVLVETAIVPHRRYLQERSALAAICDRRRPAVVHTHGYRPDVIGGSVARGRGIKTVTTVHGFTGGDRKNRLYEALQRRAFRYFDAVVAVSASLYAKLASGVPPGRLSLIQNAWDGGVEFDESDRARRELDLRDDEFVVGWVGRLSPEKGPDVLLDAMSQLTDLPVVVSMVGNGRQEPTLRERAAALRVDDLVRFHGVVPDAGRLYKAFDCFVLSSRTEGTPIVLFEAMAAGVPIVATRVGGVPDVLSESEALLVPPDDPGALADAIRLVFSDRQSAGQRAARACERLSSAFQADSWVRAYEDVYARITAGKPLRDGP